MKYIFVARIEEKLVCDSILLSLKREDRQTDRRDQHVLKTSQSDQYVLLTYPLDDGRATYCYTTSTHSPTHPLEGKDTTTSTPTHSPTHPQNRRSRVRLEEIHLCRCCTYYIVVRTFDEVPVTSTYGTLFCPIGVLCSTV